MVTAFDNIEDGEIISLEELVKKPTQINGGPMTVSKVKNAGSLSILTSNKRLPMSNINKETKKPSLNLELKNPAQSYLIKEFRKKAENNNRGGNLKLILLNFEF